MVSFHRNKNSFDFLRLVATFGIVYSHSYHLLNKEPTFGFVTDIFGILNIDFFALTIFFSISGYLIAKSADSSKSSIHYFWKRLLRIQPLLIFCCIFLIISCSFISNLSTIEYFTNINTWTYLRNIFPLFGVQFHLPGVFENNIIENGVNGTLWTLIIEERLYILIGIIFLFPIKKFKYVYLGALLILNILFFWVNSLSVTHTFNYVTSYPFQFVMMFINASAIYFAKIPLASNWKKIILILVVFSIFFPGLLIVKVWIVPFITIWFGAQKSIFTNVFKYGDITYCTYIFSFPIQQFFIYKYNNDISPEKLLLLTLLVCVPLAYFSYNYFEKKCLSFKNKVQ